MSPTCGMSSEIRVLVPRFNVGVGIEVWFLREKVEGPTLLGNPSHHFTGKVGLRWLRYDEPQPRKTARPSFRWNTHNAGFIHLDRQRFHARNLTYGRLVPSFYASGEGLG